MLLGALKQSLSSVIDMNRYTALCSHVEGEKTCRYALNFVYLNISLVCMV